MKPPASRVPGCDLLFRTAEEFYVLRAVYGVVVDFESALVLAVFMRCELDRDRARSSVRRDCSAGVCGHVERRSVCRSGRERDWRRTIIHDGNGVRRADGFRRSLLEA